MKINEKLRRLRIESGMSQDAFASISYSSVSYVKQYEKGYIKPDRFVIESIADYFFIDSDILADENNDVYLPELNIRRQTGNGNSETTNKVPTTALVSKRCRTCTYRSSTSGKLDGCIYILATGHRRGCPAGDKCSKYEKGEEAKRWKAIDLNNGGYGF